MSKLVKRITIAIVVIALISSAFYFESKLSKPKTAAGNSKTVKASTTKINPQDLLITNDEGDISIGISYMNPIQDDKDNLVFQVFLDNHQVDLSKLDLSGKVLFTNSEGLKVDNVKWSIEGSGHHVVAFIKIPKKINGKNLITPNTKYIQLELRDIGGVKSRVYKWDERFLK
ncbi:hypothetical protein SAMN04244560_02462 [Thermoanaerobacter thermohydrosulfuricus]|uniref:Uncharacterized protein n=2 Tax=Thermoanaerobacter thermohydrosulfuricus TaxID=1516 RepID=M8CWT0_THETY|nr:MULTISPECIES: hypothetical protein [Thermoanaerobacter]EMT38809.1 hypothetical protein TthWC1_1642 [Thermoanaerobacter thermohydrosulfuricus WC1]SDG50450.1 hypothetical protein SAMN04244560_02462 [Thermoanaerobacter thermohydrosulfuricus]SFE45653.1 hypothetical protein SAMN04324257_01772 [Thermoanaerobacter thermohydrosulfuricus]